MWGADALHPSHRGHGLAARGREVSAHLVALGTLELLIFEPLWGCVQVRGTRLTTVESSCVLGQLCLCALELGLQFHHLFHRAATVIRGVGAELSLQRCHPGCLRLQGSLCAGEMLGLQGYVAALELIVQLAALERSRMLGYCAGELRLQGRHPLSSWVFERATLCSSTHHCELRAGSQFCLCALELGLQFHHLLHRLAAAVIEGVGLGAGELSLQRCGPGCLQGSLCAGESLGLQDCLAALELGFQLAALQLGF